MTLMRLVEPQYGATWDRVPFYSENLKQLKYDVGQRSLSPREVVLENNLLTSDTDIDLTSATKYRVTDGHILYHPATKQRFVLDEHSTSTGTATIRTVQQAPGGVRTQIDAGATLYILSQSEHYEEINAESRQENTDLITNYVQDMTEKLQWSVADLRELRKWGVDKKMRLKERMRDIVKDLNMSILYNVPQAADGTNTAVTGGFDYLVENAGAVVDATESGLADIADLRGVLKIMEKAGVGPGDDLIMLSSIDAYHAYSDAGLSEVQVATTPGSDVTVGNIVRGLQVPGIGFVPFFNDPFINDDRVRFMSLKHFYKAYYEGQGEGGIVESARVVDEPSLSNSKVQVSTIQQKWGTVLLNAANAHYILDNTGLNG
ncbi:hypothetical protein [Blastopirellula marina]|nr:hypothetical protein [Blastopirellula marina]